MTGLIKRTLTRELVVATNLDEYFELQLAPQKAVCILSLLDLNAVGCIQKLIEYLIQSGCVFFVCWGPRAQEIHELVDGVIEARGDDWIQITSTSHEDESVQDVAWFSLNAAVISNEPLRCLFILDSMSQQNQDLQSELSRLVV